MNNITPFLRYLGDAAALYGLNRDYAVDFDLFNKQQQLHFLRYFYNTVCRKIERKPSYKVFFAAVERAAMNIDGVVDGPAAIIEALEEGERMWADYEGRIDKAIAFFDEVLNETD